MNTIYINSENSETHKPHVLILKLTDKLRRCEKTYLYQISIFLIDEKI